MKIYAATNVPKIDVEGLKKSVFYLFKYVAEQKGVRPSRLRVVKMNIESGTSKGEYNVTVYYDFLGYNSKITLYRIPTKEEIPEDYWIGSYSGERLLEQINPPSESKVKVEEAYNKFRGEIKTIVANYLSDLSASGLFDIVSTSLEKDLNNLNFSNLSTITFYANIGSINSPGYTWIQDEERKSRWSVTKDNTNASLENIWFNGISATYDLNQDSIRYSSTKDSIRQLVRTIENKEQTLDMIARTMAIEDQIKSDIESKFTGVTIEFIRHSEYSPTHCEYKLTIDGKQYTYRNEVWIDTPSYYIESRHIPEIEEDIAKRIKNFRAKIAAEERKKAKEVQEPQYEDWELNPTIYEDTQYYLESGEEQ